MAEKQTALPGSFGDQYFVKVPQEILVTAEHQQEFGSNTLKNGFTCTYKGRARPSLCTVISLGSQILCGVLGETGSPASTALL